MTNFYTKIFVEAWNAILALFSIGSVVTVIMMYTRGELSNPRQTMILVFSWLGIAVFLGAMSLGISAYEKLCRLVELKEKDSDAHKQTNMSEKEKVEPSI